MQSQATYNYKVVRQFAVMTVIWGIVGMLVGVIVAAQLVWPELNFAEWFHFGRLRPLHTNAVIFAFGGCALFATSYYVVQRTNHTTLFAPGLAAFTFWGWQLVILLAAITLPLGITTSKEYAELEWPIDILITLVWVSYAIVFFGTIAKRKTSHIYVANWFYGAFIIAVALLHLVNSAAIPVTLTKSYSAYAGVQDAMIQWWYGHNAVGFFLTAGFLGMMYYFVPKQADRPVYSYRLSVVHFWALIFTYMWAGPHHLHYTALPDWTQSVGMLFSLILLAPSWGGMINGIMTLSGAWDWTVGHVHSGALGWVAMVSIGAIYYLLPRMYGKTEMYSTKLITTHFWVATIGVVLYIASMWIAGVMQGLMWRATNPDGTLTYSFVESVKASYPFWSIRLLGGVLFLGGMLIMFYNMVKTIAGQKAYSAPVVAPQAAHA
jgi:cytochrome c oxidase cbb3-type subunit 1